MKLKAMSDDDKKKDGVLPRITTRTKWTNFQDDILAYLESNGLDEGWESDEQPSDTIRPQGLRARLLQRLLLLLSIATK